MKKRKERKLKKYLGMPLLIEETCVAVYFPGFLSSAPWRKAP